MDSPTHRPYRNHEIAGGVFFIIATAFLFLGEAFYKPILTAPDVIEAAADQRLPFVTGVLLEFTCVLAIPFIAIALYPILRQVSSALAIGYVAIRTLEAAILIPVQIDRMLILTFSEQHTANPTTNTETITFLAQAMTSGEAWSGTSGPFYNVVFVIGMLMLNWMLWRARMCPRWLSGWGLLSALVLGGLAIAAAFGPIPDLVAIVLITPLAVQEMVLALWLILKGLDTSQAKQAGLAPAT